MAILAMVSILEGLKALGRFLLFVAFWGLLIVGLVLTLLAGVKQPVEVEKVRVEYRSVCWDGASGGADPCWKEA